MRRGLYSDGSAAFVAATSTRGERRLRIALRALPEIGLAGAWVRTHPDGEADHRAMRCLADGPWQRWEAVVPWPGERLAYRFVLQDRGGFVWHLDQRGLHAREPGDIHDFVHLADPPPAWLQGATIYQVMPDRFARAATSASPAAVAAAAGLPLPPASAQPAWDDPPPAYRDGGDRAFYGGNLAGLRERLPYLRDLGVGALLLTPIFLAGTNHRYDTWDHHAVDPRLGTMDDLAALCRDLHAGGQRLILDGVFNHVGAGHRWFNRHGHFAEKGAWQDARTPTADRFFFHRHPDRYECWLGVAELVKLDYRSRALRDAIYAAPDSVVRRWLQLADGWRLDVGNMLARCGAVQLGPEVLRELRQAVKQTRPDALLMGEHFYDATGQLQGDQLDAVQNYHGFQFPLLRWLTGAEPRAWRGMPVAARLPRGAAGAGALAASLLEMRAAVPFAIAQSLVNQLSSHDTPRIATRLGGDPDLVRLAVVFQHTWPGVPGVYYGDEVGMAGGRDPANRGPMVWDPAAQDAALHAWHRRLIRLRRDVPALAAGGVRVLHARGDLLVFARLHGADAAVVALNRGAAPVALDLDARLLGWRAGELEDLLAGHVGGFMDARGRLRATLEAGQAAVLRGEVVP